MPGKILIAVKDPERKSRYTEILERHNIRYCVSNSLQDAIFHASEEGHCGVLLDMLLMVRSPGAIQNSVQDLINGLPSATLNVNASTGEIRILPRGHTLPKCSSIDHFIKFSRDFHPKIIFPRKREPIHLNALLDLKPDFSTADKTVCIDISSGGCFLFCVRDDIGEGDTVWIKIPLPGNFAVIKGTVNWIRKWGTSQEIPGIGVGFSDMPEETAKKIFELNR